jgi:hypothetical protein
VPSSSPLAGSYTASAPPAFAGNAQVTIGGPTHTGGTFSLPPPLHSVAAVCH